MLYDFAHLQWWYAYAQNISRLKAPEKKGFLVVLRTQEEMFSHSPEKCFRDEKVGFSQHLCLALGGPLPP